MKATGIVRRIDDLGRVVIPKEIRRTMRIREGDPLEIYTDKDGVVIFKKYSPMNGLSDFAAHICDAVAKSCAVGTAVSDRDTIVAAAGIPRRDLVGKQVSAGLEDIMRERQVYCHADGSALLPVSDGSDKYHISVAAPIISEGDLMGSIILFSDGGKKPDDAERKLAQTVSVFLGKQLES